MAFFFQKSDVTPLRDVNGCVNNRGMTNTPAKTTETATSYYAILDIAAHEYTVMGSGTSPEAAMADAQRWAEDWDWRGARCAEVSAERFARIADGDNAADDIWADAWDGSDIEADN